MPSNIMNPQVTDGFCERIVEATAVRVLDLIKISPLPFPDDPKAQYEEAIRRFREYLEMKNLKPRTISTYMKAAEKFLKDQEKSIPKLNADDLSEYLLNLIDNGMEEATVNACHSMLKSFYQALQIPCSDDIVPFMKTDRHLPVIYTRPQIANLLDVCDNLRDKAILSLAYGSGLRASEICTLMISDIDPIRMSVRIEGGKCRKERYTILASSTLEILRDYTRYHYPKLGFDLETKTWPSGYLFPGRTSGKPIVTATAQNAFKNWLPKIGLEPSGRLHRLRHCFGTHFIEDGGDLFTLKTLMGHKSIATTCIYVHLAQINFREAVSPADRLYKKV